MQASNLSWNTKGSDGRTWDTTGTYFLLHRPDRYVDVYQRVTGEGDIKLNTARQTIAKGKALAQQFKDNVVLEPAPAEEGKQCSDPTPASTASRGGDAGVSPAPAAEETQEVWCGSPDDPIRGNRSMTDDYHTVPMPLTVEQYTNGEYQKIGTTPDGKGVIVRHKDNPHSEGVVAFTDDNSVMPSAESRTKIDKAPEPIMEWSVIEQEDGRYTHWYSKDTKYRISRVRESNGILWAACLKNSDGHFWPLECDPPKSTHPKYYPTVQEAFAAAESHFGEVHGTEYFATNRKDILKAIDAGGGTGYKEPAGDERRSNKQARGPQSPPKEPQAGDDANTVNEPKEKKEVKVQENRIRRLFLAMGYSKANNWSFDKLTQKTNEIASLSSETNKPEDDQDVQTYKELLDALTEDDVIKIVPDEDDDTVNEPEEKTVTTTATATMTRTRKKKNVESNGTTHANDDAPLTESPWTEKAPKLVPLTARLAAKFATMDRFPRDREIQKNRTDFLREEINSGRFRGCEWASCHVKEVGVTYRMNGKHSSNIFHEMYTAEQPVPDCMILVREYECDTMEEASRLFATFDAKQNARSKADVIRGFAVASSATADFSPRLLSVLTAAVAYTTWGDAYRRYSPADQAALLLQHEEFATWIKDLVGGKNKAKHMIRMSVFAAMLKTWEKDADAALEFWTEIRDDSDAPKDAPQRVLYRYLVQAKVGGRDATERVGEKEVLSKCLQAWNAWRAKEKTVKLKYAKDAALPAVK